MLTKQKNIKLLSIDNFICTIIVYLVLIFFPLFFQIDFLNQIQNTVQDFYVTDIIYSQIRNNDKYGKDTNIVIVNIGNLDRRGIALLINKINSYEPKIIGFDSFFWKLKTEELDIPLQNALSNVKNLVMVSKLDYKKSLDKDINADEDSQEEESAEDNSNLFDTLLTSHPNFNQNAQTGFANIVLTEEHFKTVRFFAPKWDYSDKTELNFTTKILHIYDTAKFNKLLKRDNLLEIINFKRNFDKYATFEGIDVLAGNDSIQNVLKNIKGKIVLFGFVGPKLNTLVTEDILFTPLNDEYIGKSFPDMYGVVVHANILSMLLEEDYINTFPSWLAIVISILIVYFNMTFLGYIRKYYEEWYEPSGWLMIIIELLSIFTLVVFCFIFLNFELKLRESLFAIVLCPTIFETYNDSLKPLILNVFDKLKTKFAK